MLRLPDNTGHSKALQTQPSSQAYITQNRCDFTKHKIMGYYQWLPQDEQTNIKSVDKLDYKQAFRSSISTPQIIASCTLTYIYLMYSYKKY